MKQRELSYIVRGSADAIAEAASGARDPVARVGDEHYAVGEFSLPLLGWDRPRLFVVIREQLRAQVFLCGSLLGRAGRRLVLHLSTSWGGPQQRVPLLENILTYRAPTLPEFNP